MTLIVCPECHNQVSDLASACPHCGCPVIKFDVGVEPQPKVKKYEDINLEDVTYSSSNQQSYQQDIPVNRYVNNNYYSNSASVQKTESTLSTVALWLSVLFLPIIGWLLGIIDKSTDKERRYTHKGSTFAIIYGSIVLGVSFIVGLVWGLRGGKKTNNIEYIPVEQTEISELPEPEPVVTKKNYNIKVANNMDNMTIGDIGEKDDVYVGLSYVKRMSYLPDALDGKVEVSSSNNEVIIGFFEFFNGSGEVISVGSPDITCYADGTQVKELESVFKVEVDGVRRDYNAELDPETNLIICQDFEVNKDWKELKFYYESSCVWVISQDDVDTDAFSMNPLLHQEVKKTKTSKGATIYDDKYQIVYDGFSYYTYHNSVWGNTPYIIFKFKINNTSDDALDCSLVGYRMRAYQDNYALDDAEFGLHDNIDGYVNIFDIDKIEKGMSANIYIAFESDGSEGDLYMVYDDGYMEDETKGFVYAVPEETNLTIEVSP